MTYANGKYIYLTDGTNNLLFYGNNTLELKQGDVLYLALEDTEKRLQGRIKESGIDSTCMPSRLDIVTEIPRQDEGGLDYIKVWLADHPEAKLVIVDTLQKFRKLSKGKLNVYAEDYETLSEMKKVADEFNVSFLVIHHLKKMSAKEEAMGDWINQLSGSAGITGCADTILALKRERVSTHGILRITGRHILCFSCTAARTQQQTRCKRCGHHSLFHIRSPDQ